MQSDKKRESLEPVPGSKLSIERIIGVVTAVIVLLAAVVKLLEALHILP